MAKYSLWISDQYLNRFCVPLSRDGKNYKEKNELYEIDLLTVSLGKNKFIDSLKNSNLAPNQFDWSSVYSYIRYQMNHRTCYLPLLFVGDNVRDKLLIQVLNFHNKYRYHNSKTEGKIITEFQTKPLQSDFSSMISSLSQYRDAILNQVKENQYLLDNCNIPRKLARKLYSCIQSTDYEEQREYKNDILIELLSYITFRRMKTIEYGCVIEQESIAKQEVNLEEDEFDPDEIAFLTKEELDMMYGIDHGEKHHEN